MSDEDGLLDAYRLDGTGGAEPLSWEDLSDGIAQEGLLWVHLDKNGAQTGEWLRTQSGLDDLQIDALTADETQPRVARIGDGILLTLRGVNLNPGADPEDMVSLRMWATDRLLISVRLRPIVAVADVRDSLNAGNGPVDICGLICDIGQGLLRRMAPVMNSMNERIDDLEEHVLESASLTTRHALKELRHEAIALRRYLSPQRDALMRLYGERLSWMSEQQRFGLREIADHAARIVEDLDSMRERAAVIQDELNNRMADSMNRNMYTLSVIAALMLPLGVITGMLGMNVGGIPLSESRSGFAIVIGLLGVIVALQVVIFRRLRWI